MSFRRHRRDAQREAAQLDEPVREAGELARKLGLDPYPVNYWVVNYDEMNQLIAYGGFQERYPHWRWGMTYDRQRKSDQFGMGKAFEIVNNDDPANAFLQESNSLADQKAVITHVEAHSDFFKNNQWFRLFSDDGQFAAAAMLEQHAQAIERYVQNPDVSRDEVEKFIDAVLCLEDTIDQHRSIREAAADTDSRIPEDIRAQLDSLDISDDVRREVFDEEWLEGVEEAEREAAKLTKPRKDVLAYIREHGMRYDDETEKAEEMEPWQKDVLDMLREESYYFAAQKMTKVMNEGWAAYWESLMMGDEHFAGTDEFITYADHQARVLGSPGLNPYKLGKELWEYIENTTNRAAVADKLLRVKGITWRNFHDMVDFEEVQQLLRTDPAIDGIHADAVDDLADLSEDDPRVDHEVLDRALSGDDTLDLERYPWKLLTYEGLAERHYSLIKPQNRGFLRRIRRSELEQLSRYMFDDDQYDSIEEAVADVDKTTGWDRMREIRESHNDVTFLDAFLTEEFVRDNHYFAYEYSRSSQQFRVSSSEYEDVKKKLLFQFTNFGKPTIAVYDGNFDNRGELLLGHQYNGVILDKKQAKGVLERVYHLWGRPVNLMTIIKEFDDHEIEVARRRGREPTPVERAIRIRYDGDEFEEHDLDSDLEERIAASDIDYDTKPDDWL
ncbi:AbrB family transcriptional regulator [Haloferax mediterranei ATCC 33500]|uniref:AbrB family transcriptional regulator n=1 Tax=Haloferax mediterranei (strain ATCC 33500 / DSM 1411 / JCM 8866 / NBRC 14739 / NCIMB 2177 / R-4) TaxID=523841 RepID=I3R8E6_HALMT|nr:SpoVR family protein [Haloferax mediterranei]AFK20506.1 spore cortext formation protein [Haloferax mediterranei ATCC 33500]AHZ23865.1 AbrB family transcriptional regulator [Haloferax mediterranei ATCC 33500]ELZ98289.1 spore cortext formation protein [Haloferax mediterranei ATCC 33500]MDX5986738.1 SpoVR family protein [Haloferax mediterranei ATCC 33500]QCQ76062.1 AbrB family transcriptional regulator [Haloferax mediterranei ATCC 33500]